MKSGLIKLLNLLKIIGIFTIALLCFPVSTVFAIGQWNPTGYLQNILGGYSILTSLPDDKILSVGGVTSTQWYSQISQIYDPSTGLWKLTDSMPYSKGQYIPILLNNGMVLVAGGEPLGGGVFANSELYNPSTGVWTSTGSLNHARSAAAEVKLSDGKVLIVSGDTHLNGPLYSSEIYDPSTGNWSLTGNVNNPTIGFNEGDNIVLLNDGRVLKVGNGFSGSSSVAEIYDPASGIWVKTNDILVPRYLTKLIKLKDGKVLMISGDQWGANVGDCEIFDPESESWTETGSVNYPRSGFGAVLLEDGRVLIAGGANISNEYILQSEIYDPATGKWTYDALLSDAHHSVTMVKFSNGKLFLAGGFNALGPTSTSEIYTPDILVTPTPTPTKKPKNGQGNDILSPFNNKVTWKVLSGYYNNLDQSYSGCHIGVGPDHCRNQLFGLDIVPDQQSDTQVLAPANGTIMWKGRLEGGCIGLRIKLDNGLNMNVCHFATFNVNLGKQVSRGEVLGTRNTTHVHLSLDDRYGTGNQCKEPENCNLPVPFSGKYALDGISYDPDVNGQIVVLPYPKCDKKKINCEFKVGKNQYQGFSGVSTNIVEL